MTASNVGVFRGEDKRTVALLGEVCETMRVVWVEEKRREEREGKQQD